MSQFGAEFIESAGVTGGWSREGYYTLDYLLAFGYEGLELYG